MGVRVSVFTPRAFGSWIPDGEETVQNINVSQAKVWHKPRSGTLDTSLIIVKVNKHK